jgi:hypothetical protein
MVREAASKSEAAALDAVDRAEAALARRRADWSRAKEVGGQVVQSLGHMGRTTVSGVAEFNGALGRYGKGALTDTIDIGRKSIASKDFGEVVDLFVDYISHRSRALFASIDELNAIARASTFAAWSPIGDLLSKGGERGAA